MKKNEVDPRMFNTEVASLRVKGLKGRTKLMSKLSEANEAAKTVEDLVEINRTLIKLATRG